MRMAKHKRAKRRTADGRRRPGLLAKIHIAKKELCLDDDLYRFILKDEFGAASAADLTEPELETLLRRFMSKGWTPKQGTDAQIAALQERIGQALLNSSLTPARLHGLTRKICGVDDPRWCRETRKLKRLLAALEHIIKKEQNHD